MGHPVGYDRRRGGGAARETCESYSRPSFNGPLPLFKTPSETWVRVLPNELEKAEVAADVPEEDRTPPSFQYLDITEQRWRDAGSDRILEARIQERLSQILDALHTFLGPVLDADCLEEIEAAWSEHGPPDEAIAGIREAMLTPSEWRQLLPPCPVTETEGDDTPAGRQTI